LQFREIPALMEGRAQPDCGRCVAIATAGALREMVVPGPSALLIPLAVGFLLGKEALGGLLAGAIVTGVAWDNAKKYIEEGHPAPHQAHDRGRPRVHPPLPVTGPASRSSGIVRECTDIRRAEGEKEPGPKAGAAGPVPFRRTSSRPVGGCEPAGWLTRENG